MWWLLRSSDGTISGFQFGNSTDKPVPDDYTGDGKTDMAFWRPSTGEWFVQRSEDFNFYSFQFGQSGDIPISADFFGDKRADYVIYRNGAWYVHNVDFGVITLHLGTAGDIPVPADYDGDSKADIAVFRPLEELPGEPTREGIWKFVNRDVQFGIRTDIPIPGFLVVQ